MKFRQKSGDTILGGVAMKHEKKTVITGSLDKDQLGYETNFNPENVSYVGPRTADNHQVIASHALEDLPDSSQP
jgi:hypothetical protein